MICAFLYSLFTLSTNRVGKLRKGLLRYTYLTPLLNMTNMSINEIINALVFSKRDCENLKRACIAFIERTSPGANADDYMAARYNYERMKACFDILFRELVRKHPTRVDHPNKYFESVVDIEAVTNAIIFETSLRELANSHRTAPEFAYLSRTSQGEIAWLPRGWDD